MYLSFIEFVIIFIMRIIFQGVSMPGFDPFNKYRGYKKFVRWKEVMERQRQLQELREKLRKELEKKENKNKK